MKRCFLATNNLEARSLLESNGIEPVLRKHKTGRLTEDELIAELSDCDAAIAGGEPFSKKVIDASPKLKIIARIGVGYDSVDVDYATAKGIAVTLTPVPEQAKGMSEHAVALMLSFAKQIPYANREIRSGGWGWGPEGREIQDVYGKTLGLFGVGRIGGQVAKRATAFEMNVIYYDVVRRNDLEESLGIEYVSFDDLLARSDFLSIHSPLNEQTRGIINAKAISKMKKNAVLINTARGAIVDEKALAQALVEHRLAGACLDALSEEPPGPDHVFYRLGDRIPNLILTPHRGFSAATSHIMEMAAANEVVSVLNGRPPKYLLNTSVRIR